MEKSQILTGISEDETTKNRDIFFRATIGETMALPLTMLKPTQPDDGQLPNGAGSIEACADKGNILIIHGHHRYYRGIERSQEPGAEISHPVTKVRNPYTDY